MKWILLIVAFNANGGQSAAGRAVHSIEFDSKPACEFALGKLEAHFVGRTTGVHTFCFPKGALP